MKHRYILVGEQAVLIKNSLLKGPGTSLSGRSEETSLTVTEEPVRHWQENQDRQGTDDSSDSLTG